MKDNNKLIGIVLLASAMLLMLWQSNDQAARLKAWKEANPLPEQTEPVSGPISGAASAVLAPSIVAPASPLAPVEVVAKPTVALAEEKTYVLENKFLKITFTSRAGAVKEIAFKEYPKTQGTQEPYVMRAPEGLPFLALASVSDLSAVDLSNYLLVDQTENKLVFAAKVSPTLGLVREYTLTSPAEKRTAEGYLLEQKLTWVNSGEAALEFPAYAQNIAIAAPVEGDPHNTFLNFGYKNGQEAKFKTMQEFKGGGFLFWSSPAKDKIESEGSSIAWATVKNQFFTAIMTPEKPANGAVAIPYMLEEGKEGMAGFVSFPSVRVEGRSQLSQNSTIYFGPKEYARLASMGGKQDEVMQWGWPLFAFFSQLFISMLNGIAHAVKNYGVAIIVLTLVIRAVMWPFTAAAAQASKKMASIQPVLNELRKKYKDNRAKLEKETLRLFQENQVNPLAGCLPALLQIPVFIGFFYMLRSAAELRFESFLWIKDLSMPDTIATIGGFPINPLPIVMFVTMYYQIKLTPSSGDPEQQKIMQFTPFIFAFMLYGFSSGLTLYWTLSNLLSIIQQLIVNRQQAPVSFVHDDEHGGKNGKVIDISSYNK